MLFEVGARPAPVRRRRARGEAERRRRGPVLQRARRHAAGRRVHARRLPREARGEVRDHRVGVDRRPLPHRVRPEGLQALGRKASDVHICSLARTFPAGVSPELPVTLESAKLALSYETLCPFGRFF